MNISINRKAGVYDMDKFTIDTLNIEINGDVNIYIYCNNVPKKLNKAQVYAILN